MTYKEGVAFTATLENTGSSNFTHVKFHNPSPSTTAGFAKFLYASCGVLEPEVLERIPEGQHYDVPDLVRALLEANEPVGALSTTGFGSISAIRTTTQRHCESRKK